MGFANYSGDPQRRIEPNRVWRVPRYELALRRFSNLSVLSAMHRISELSLAMLAKLGILALICPVYKDPLYADIGSSSSRQSPRQF